MAVAKKSKSQKSVNKPNGKPKVSEPAGKANAGVAAVAPRENEAQIAVHWKEEEYFHPSPKFIGQANLNDPAVVERFSE
jgi:hypothetical protein